MDVLPLTDALGERLLADEEMEQMETALLAVLLESLDANHEPTGRGVVVDALIGRLQPYAEYWHRDEDA